MHKTLAARSLFFAIFFGVHNLALLKIFVSFQVSDVSCTRKRSERAKRAHSLYNIIHKFSTINSLQSFHSFLSVVVLFAFQDLLSVFIHAVIYRVST